MPELYGFDAFSPPQIAERIEQVGVAKLRLPWPATAMLGLLAGAFIGLGAVLFVLVKSDATLGFAAGQLLGGLAFSLGLLLVVVAGAELFTGNNLMVMAWADGRIRAGELLGHWALVCAANFAGAAGLALLVFLADHHAGNQGAIGAQTLAIAAAKSQMVPVTAFFRGILCNVLVCMAVWMAMAGRTVTDKAIAVVFPIAAFVAAGFEHSIANVYFGVSALLLQGAGADAAISAPALAAQLLAVLAGNLFGGAVLVGLVYHVIYKGFGR
jgi:formate transporter